MLMSSQEDGWPQFSGVAFFRKCDDSNAASCIVRNKNNDECGAKISRSHSSTSQLFKHLKSCHRAQYNEVRKLRSKDNQLPANQKQLSFRSESDSLFDLIVIVRSYFCS